MITDGIIDAVKVLGGIASQPTNKEHKVKYFKPTIIESFWGTKIIWEEREKPLTDSEMEKYL